MRILNDIFLKEKFVDYETAVKSRDILTKNILAEAEKNGKNEVDLLTIIYRKVLLNKEHPEKSEKKYFIGVKMLPPNTMDNMPYFDSSLITYYMNKLKGKRPVIKFIVGSSAEAKYLKHFSEEEIIKRCDLLTSEGDLLGAKKIQHTWQLAQETAKFEEIEYI